MPEQFSDMMRSNGASTSVCFGAVHGLVSIFGIFDGGLDLERVRVHAPIALDDVQRVGMGRHAALRGHPGVVGEVGRIDDQRIAVPAADRIAAIGGRHIVTMRPAVGRDDRKPWYVSVSMTTIFGVATIWPTAPTSHRLTFSVPNAVGTQRSVGSSLSPSVLAFAAASGLYNS